MYRSLFWRWTADCGPIPRQQQSHSRSTSQVVRIGFLDVKKSAEQSDVTDVDRGKYCRPMVDERIYLLNSVDFVNWVGLIVNILYRPISTEGLRNMNSMHYCNDDRKSNIRMLGEGSLSFGVCWIKWSPRFGSKLTADRNFLMLCCWTCYGLCIMQHWCKTTPVTTTGMQAQPTCLLGFKDVLNSYFARPCTFNNFLPMR